MSLANVLYRLGYESDATAIMQHSLEVRCPILGGRGGGEGGRERGRQGGRQGGGKTHTSKHTQQTPQPYIYTSLNSLEI